MHTLSPNQFAALSTAFHTSEYFGSPEQGVAFDPTGAVFVVDLLDGEIREARPASLADTLQTFHDVWCTDGLTFDAGLDAWLLLAADALPQTASHNKPQGALSLVAYDSNTRTETRALALDETGNTFTVTVKGGEIRSSGKPEPMAPADSVRLLVDLMRRDCWSGCDEPLSMRWLGGLLVALRA